MIEFLLKVEIKFSHIIVGDCLRCFTQQFTKVQD
jgi:hypothetical protein